MLKVYVVPKDDSAKEKFKAWCKNRKTDIEVWWSENKETVIALTPVIVGGVTVAFKFGNKFINLRQEKKMRERAIWDPQQMHWWYMKKAPSQEQWAEITRRKNAGESVSDILVDLGMLKR